MYCVCEEMAGIDLGIATAVLATFLGSDPITVGATPEQKKLWLAALQKRVCSSPMAQPSRTPAATWAR